MKRIIQLSLIVFTFTVSLFAADKGGDELQRKSEFNEVSIAPGINTTYPMPFDQLTQFSGTNYKTAAASTGYYFYDNLEKPINILGFKDRWAVKTYDLDKTSQEKYWYRILPGPRMTNPSFWFKNPIGKYYFRNPADMATGSIFDPKRTGMDSTLNAIAGPITMGIDGGFFFNGIRYDSFYVSTTGAISLANRRYIYDSKGNKTIPVGAKNCYDVYSADWFVGGPIGTSYPNGTRLRTDNPQTGAVSDGLNDRVPDNFGYKFGALGSDPKRFYENPVDDPMNKKDAGIRNPGITTGNKNLSNLLGAGYASLEAKPAIIAPFWGNVMLSQRDRALDKAEDFSKVFFKYSPSGDQLTILYENVLPHGLVTEPNGDSYTLEKDDRPGYGEGLYMWDAAVVFSKIDSSISIIFKNLRGKSKNGFSCGDMIRSNTICGVVGWARHKNFSSKNAAQQTPETDVNYPWGGEYMQYTHYFSNVRDAVENSYPFEMTTVTFKQWKNVVRALDIAYRVRSTTTPTNPNYNFTVNLDEPNNYEILAGERLIGAIQPIGLVQNMSNEIQSPDGVNFIPQDFEFEARFRLRNVATGRIVYSKTLPISYKCMSIDANWQDCYDEDLARVRLVSATNAQFTLAGTTVMTGATYKANAAKFNGVPAYYMAQIQFPAFEPNLFGTDHIGRLEGKLIALTVKDGQDTWPFDDSVTTTLNVMKRLNDFSDNSSNYDVDVTTNRTIPSTMKWVSVNADVVDGNSISQHPMPPRGDFRGINSPVLRLNRTYTNSKGLETDAGLTAVTFATEKGSSTFIGDELRSFPIDLRGKLGSILNISVQRGANYYDGWMTGKDRFYSDTKLNGPEAKVFSSLNPFAYVAAGNSSAYPDMLVVEFARPSDDGVNNITNIPNTNWNFHPQRKKSNLPPVTGVPALTLYGGGGYLIGFLESDPDSALKYPANPLKNSLRDDFYDTGYDLEFRKFFVAIPDTFIKWNNDGARNLRFRIRVLAKNNTMNNNSIKDDNDDFFVDNVSITTPKNKTDIAVSSVRINWPYSYSPASQVSNVPVTVRVSNNTTLTAAVFNLKVKIFYKDDFDFTTMKEKDGKKPIYCRSEAVSNLNGGTELDIKMPDWNARKHGLMGINEFVFATYVYYPEDDADNSNNVTYSIQKIALDEIYAYESTLGTDKNGINNVQDEYDFAKVTNYLTYIPENKVPVGRGLNLPAYSVSALNSFEPQIGVGTVTDAYSGRIAIKFELKATDTLRAFNVFFSNNNSHPDLVEFCLYENKVLPDGTDYPSITQIPGTYIEHQRGWFDGDLIFNKYMKYYLPEPLELTSGKYWIAITQTAQDGINLGASADRSAVRVTSYDAANPTLTKNVYLDRNFRTMKKGINVNDNKFVYSNTVSSGQSDYWGIPFAPDLGYLGYPHTNANGLSIADKVSITYTNGTWIPMIQPYFGKQEYGIDASHYEVCPDDWHNPVELTAFSGKAIKDGIELAWETASEINNKGFEIERQIKGNDSWTIEALVDGHGNSKDKKYYNFLDRNVEIGNIYSYRLRQIDIDGTISCEKSRTVTVAYDNNGNYILYPNSPNPVENVTAIKFEMPTAADAKVEIIDMYGNVVKVIVDGPVNKGFNVYNWDSKDAAGNSVSSGSYIYRLTSGDKVLTGKLTVVR